MAEELSRNRLALLSRSGGRTGGEVIIDEVWNRLEGLTSWIPGRTGRPPRSMLYRPFLYTDGALDVAELPHIRFPGRLRCGKGVSIGRLCQLTCTGGLDLGDDVIIGPQVLSTTTNHVWSDPQATIRSQGLEHDPITIGRDDWIGGHATSGRDIGAEHA